MSKNNEEELELVKDLVCKMVKPKNQMKAKAVFNGVTYYFCSEGDKEIFVAHPESWVAKKGENIN